LGQGQNFISPKSKSTTLKDFEELMDQAEFIFGHLWRLQTEKIP
jgi:hypothetical protein